MSNTTITHNDGNTLFPIVLSIVAAAATGVLWAYANPIQLVPGVIQWRILHFCHRWSASFWAAKADLSAVISAP